ncbi:MAG: hypothetical protein ABSG46_20580 [Candidatus Binataceae bacterium]|jgi:hypothetical protein
MQDTTKEHGTDFRPGKAPLRVTLTGNVAQFLANAGQEIADAYDAADDVDELIKLLEGHADWTSYDMDWTPPRGGAKQTFHNVYRSTQTSATEELRVIVTKSSRGDLSVTFHTWWKPA